MNHTSSYYRVKGDEVGQPDLISYRLYDTEEYWWIICLVNKIENPLEDIVEGTISNHTQVEGINCTIKANDIMVCPTCSTEYGNALLKKHNPLEDIEYE